MIMRKSVKLSVLTGALILTAALGCAAAGQPSPRERYEALLGEGVITEAEFEKLEQYNFELPESERQPIDDFLVGSISAEMQLPADAGGPPHGGNHPPMDPLTLRGGATGGEISK